MTISAQPHSILLQKAGIQAASVTVCISLYNYENYIVETLESVYQQTLEAINLIIVDDHSIDQSTALAQTWLNQNQTRFNSVILLRHHQNCGLAAARNTAISQVTTPFIFILDADNTLYPRCLAQCLEAIEASDAAFAYPLIEKFGHETGIMGNLVWNRDRLAQGNYIDAMALVRRSAMIEVSGYTKMPHPGWEDYDLWCKLAEQGHFGVLVPEVLARYRTHQQSMLQTITNRAGNIETVIADMTKRHPWLQLTSDKNEQQIKSSRGR